MKLDKAVDALRNKFGADIIQRGTNVAYKAIAFYINREYNKLTRNGWKDIG